MQQAIPLQIREVVNTEVTIHARDRAQQRLSGYERKFIWLAIRVRIFYFACLILRSPRKILRTFQALTRLRTDVWGGDLKKLYRIGGRYYFNQYTPGWPSKAYDLLIKKELQRHAAPITGEEKLSFVFLAITRKCPMRCEHCFEWDNLNQKESFTADDLLKVVDLYKREGVRQFHFSGGEPMVRVNDLIALIKHAGKDCDCWVLTSGFNVTEENAMRLKKAGCKGMVISIDHYQEEVHNLFRGRQYSYGQALQAVAAAKKAGLVTSLSVCATKTFLEGGHLLPYMDFAKNLGVQFVQVLEPRNIGHYEGKDVLLAKKHVDQLEETFTLLNHHPRFQSYPTMLYHGYHQRRVGCFSGSRSVYVDSAGDVHACPFCHTSAYNIIDIVRNGETVLPKKENACPQFGKIA